MKSELGTEYDTNYYSMFPPATLQKVEERYLEAISIKQKLTKSYIEGAVSEFSFKKNIGSLTLFKKILTEFLEPADAAALKCVSQSVSKT